MKLHSTAFKHNSSIPAKYTCDGENTSPPLSWSDIPADAKSLVLIMDDPDIPDFVKQSRGIQVFDHWVVYDIHPAPSRVDEGSEPKGVAGLNSAGREGYTGPCPPDREHRYFFKFYALDAMLNIRSGASKEEVLAVMQGHILDRAELIGRYERLNT